MTTLVRKLLLTPDAFASRRVRTLLADKAVGLGVKVVTPNELIEELRLAYLIPNTEIEWVEQIREGMDKFPNSFLGRELSCGSGRNFGSCGKRP